MLQLMALPSRMCGDTTRADGRLVKADAGGNIVTTIDEMADGTTSCCLLAIDIYFRRSTVSSVCTAHGASRRPAPGCSGCSRHSDTCAQHENTDSVHNHSEQEVTVLNSCSILTDDSMSTSRAVLIASSTRA